MHPDTFYVWVHTKGESMRSTPLTIHLTDEEREAIDRVARDHDRSRGSVVRLALRHYLEANQKRGRQDAAQGGGPVHLAI